MDKLASGLFSKYIRLTEEELDAFVKAKPEFKIENLRELDLYSIILHFDGFRKILAKTVLIFV